MRGVSMEAACRLALKHAKSRYPYAKYMVIAVSPDGTTESVHCSSMLEPAHAVQVLGHVMGDFAAGLAVSR